jgi:hypothetical protein
MADAHTTSAGASDLKSPPPPLPLPPPSYCIVTPPPRFTPLTCSFDVSFWCEIPHPTSCYIHQPSFIFSSSSSSSSPPYRSELRRLKLESLKLSDAPIPITATYVPNTSSPPYLSLTSQSLSPRPSLPRRITVPGVSIQLLAKTLPERPH